MPLPSISFGIKVISLKVPARSISIEISWSDELWISFTRELIAWSPTPNGIPPTFKILSPVSKPALKAAFSGCVANTRIPGSGS